MIARIVTDPDAPRPTEEPTPVDFAPGDATLTGVALGDVEIRITPTTLTAADVTEALLAVEPPLDSMREARERVRIITITREIVEAEHAERTEEARLLAREIAPDQSIPSIIATAKAEALADFFAAWREAIDPI